MKKILLAVVLLLFSQASFAACKWVWVDHDFSSSTPAIRKQVCDSSIDIPAINTPSIRPIQTPQIRPIPSIGIPPLGTTRCSDQSVYNSVTRKWENKRVCT